MLVKILGNLHHLFRVLVSVFKVYRGVFSKVRYHTVRFHTYLVFDCVTGWSVSDCICNAYKRTFVCLLILTFLKEMPFSLLRKCCGPGVKKKVGMHKASVSNCMYSRYIVAMDFPFNMYFAKVFQTNPFVRRHV